MLMILVEETASSCGGAVFWVVWQFRVPPSAEQPVEDVVRPGIETAAERESTEASTARTVIHSVSALADNARSGARSNRARSFDIRYWCDEDCLFLTDLWAVVKIDI